jgi:signal transduction histidine kinase
MAPVTSTSTARRLPVVNESCALRRNVAVQPYGRCSVCSLKLRQCHAWQSSAMSFGLVMLILAPIFLHELHEPWAVKLTVALALLLLVVQGAANHKKTDDLIFGQHELAQARQNLEAQVAARTESLRQTNIALARANLELEELAKRREQMVLEVSHDLRTPLTSVKGAAENLLDGIAGNLDDSQREYVEIVRDHAQRLIAAISKLVDAAREPEPTIDLDLGPVDVGALARDVARSLQPIAEERGVDLVVNAGEVEAFADADKLRKVMENLVGNALKFTDRGGTVRVGVACSEGNVRLSVEDTGVGIEEKDLAKVFERFHRGRDTERPGSGLGLAITRDLVRLHGGDVVAQSAPGLGSTFAAVLPRGPSSVAGSAA